MKQVGFAQDGLDKSRQSSGGARDSEVSRILLNPRREQFANPAVTASKPG